MKIMRIHATTEGNETTISQYDAPSLNALLFAMIPDDFKNKSEIIETVSKEGEFSVDDESYGYEKFALQIWKESSIFGTDYAIMQVWEDDDILDRYNDTFIVLPEGGIN